MTEWDDCPHCHALVLLMGDRTCPACRKSADDPKGATPFLQRLAVSAGQVLPKSCFACGKPTSRFERFAPTRVLGGESGFVKLLTILGGVLFPRLVLEHSSEIKRDVWGEKQRVTVEVGRCQECAASGPIREEHVDFERGTVVLLVHRRFADAVANTPPTRCAAGSTEN
ncbi:MAG: hypothetical protein ACYC8T_31950 [Myxococcaceae bacterium]